MHGEILNAKRPAEPPRPIANAPLFPPGVTVDRNIVRLFVAAAISCLQVATLIYGIKPAPLSLAASAAYIVWAIVGLFPPRYGSPIFRAPVWVGRLVELALCAAIIATGGPVLLGFLAAAVALFLPQDYLRHITQRTTIKALLIAGLVCAALLFGHRWGPPMMQTPSSPFDEAFAGLVFAMFAVAVSGGAIIPRQMTWNDELSHHVAFASKAPMERLLELIAERIGGTVAMVFTGGPDRPLIARVVHAGEDHLIELDEKSGGLLYAPRAETRPFLFDSKASKSLFEDHRGRIGVRDTPAFGQAWNGLFAPARGTAIPVGMGRARGWLYIVTGQDLTHRSFLELRKVATDINGMILRFERFESWRERTLAEARLLASRDMHDSVLQTLAGLRMQLSSMVKASEAGGSAQINAQMKTLDGIVAAEQQHLRAVLKRSHENAETAAELFSYLESRAQSLARQWNMRCSVQIPDESLPVSEETAIECEFLLREAISNAAQHASADHVALAMALEDNTLLVTLRTEGKPSRNVKEKGDRKRPIESRSLRQRVDKLGGTAYLQSISGGGVLSIQIPLERK